MAVESLAEIRFHHELPTWTDPKLAPICGDLPLGNLLLPALDIGGCWEGQDIEPFPKTHQSRTVNEYYLSLREEYNQLLHKILGSGGNSSGKEGFCVATDDGYPSGYPSGKEEVREEIRLAANEGVAVDEGIAGPTFGPRSFAIDEFRIYEDGEAINDYIDWDAIVWCDLKV